MSTQRTLIEPAVGSLHVIPQETAPSMRHVPALDGIRSLAILGVFIFHVVPNALPGGFCGVDVFFVLSGYLIASVLLHDLRNGRFSMREFYLRRIQRLVPNAVAATTFTALVTGFVLLPSQARTTAWNAICALFEVSNFYISKSFGGYWGDSAASAPLLHTWSLGVEEQFYMFFPLTLFLLSRRYRSFLPLALLTAASLALCLFETGPHPDAAFYLLPARAWEPLAGATLAAFLLPANPHKPQRRLRASLLFAVIGWLGIATICLAFSVVPERGFPGFWALLPTIGSACVIVSIVAHSGPARFLSTSVPGFIGRISYSLYLWHWPLIVIGREFALLHGYRALTGSVIGAALSILLALLAYFCIELPFRRRGPGRRTRLIALAAIFSVCVAAVASVAVRPRAADPFHLFDQPRFSGVAYSVVGWDGKTIAKSARYYDVGFPPVPPLPPDIWNQGGIIHPWGPSTPRVVVMGSSHALMYAPVIDSICRDHRLPVAFFSADDTSVYFPTTTNHFASLQAAAGFDEARRKFVDAWHPDVLFLVDRWDRGETSPVHFQQSLTRLVASFSPKVGRIILITQPPVMQFGSDLNAREFVTRYYSLHHQLPQIQTDSHEAFRRSAVSVIDSVARSFPNVTVIPADTLFYEKNGSVHYAEGRSFLYADGDHLSDAGAATVRGLLQQAILDATASRNTNPSDSANITK